MGERMTIHYHTCDHCGKRVNEMKDYVEIEIEIKEFYTVDLCKDCFDKLDNVVRKFIKREVVS